MGYAKTASEEAFLQAATGAQWNLVRDDPLVFARFVDFAENEASMDPEKFIQRLRVAFSRHQLPTAFLVALLARFFFAGAHAGLRRFVDRGIEYFCDPADFDDLLSATRKFKGYGRIVKWEMAPRTEIRLGVFASFVDPESYGAGNPHAPIWERENWPEVMVINGETTSVFFRELQSDAAEFDTGSPEDNRTTLFLKALQILGLCFNRRLALGLNQPIDHYVLLRLLGTGIDSKRDDPTPETLLYNLTELLTLTRVRPHSFPGRIREDLEATLSAVAARFSHLSGRIERDVDHRFAETLPLLDQAMRRTYFLVPYQFQRAFRPVITRNFDELVAAIKAAREDGFEHNAEPVVPENTERPDRIPLPTLRAFLEHHEERCFARTAFDIVCDDLDKRARLPSGRAVGRPRNLMELVRDAIGTTRDVGAGARFYLSHPLLRALEGQYTVKLDAEPAQYGTMEIARADGKSVVYDVKGPPSFSDAEARLAAFVRVFKPNHARSK